MNDELLTMVERDVLSWPGVTKETKRGVARARAAFGFRQPPSTGSAVGRLGTSTTPAWRTSRSREGLTMSLSPMNGRSRTGLDSQAL